MWQDQDNAASQHPAMRMTGAHALLVAEWNLGREMAS
jgi:hypothetical protein